MTAKRRDEQAAGRVRFTFGQLHRLLRHLRRGGTRRGACGWAGIAHEELECGLENEPRLASAVERSEGLGLARDEIRLAGRVERGDRESLLFRMKTVYGYTYGKGPGGCRTGGKRRARDGENGEGERLRRSIEKLGEDERRKVVEAYRETAGAAA